MNIREQVLDAVRNSLEEFGIKNEHLAQRITVRVLHIIMSSHK